MSEHQKLIDHIKDVAWNDGYEVEFVEEDDEVVTITLVKQDEE